MRSEDWAGRDGGLGGTRFEPLPGARSIPVTASAAGPAADVQPVDLNDPAVPDEVCEVAERARGLGPFRAFRSPRG